jgi:hypothetical protein
MNNITNATFQVLEMKGMSGRTKEPIDFSSSWGDAGWDTAPQAWDATATDNWATSTTAAVASGCCTEIVI